MGRAARIKRQRGQTRTWRTRNPWSGKPETFPVCVSDEALCEWEENRIRLAKAGYPDRPPEFDSTRLRGWNLLAPGAPMHLGDWGDIEQCLGVDPSAKALGLWQTGDAGNGVKINVGRHDDGSFVLHLVVQVGQEEASRVFSVPDDAEARALVLAVNAALAVPFGLPPLHWTSADELFAELGEAA